MYMYECSNHSQRPHPPPHAGLPHNTVQLGLLWVLLADVADVGLRVVGDKPRLVYRDRTTGLALVGLGGRGLDEGGHRG